MHAYTLRFLLALVYTIAVESSVIWWLLRKEPLLSFRNIFPAILTANLTTLPYVWFVIPVLLYQPGLEAFVVGEVLAFTFEALFYRVSLNIPLQKALLISLTANTASLVSWRLIF